MCSNEITCIRCRRSAWVKWECGNCGGSDFEQPQSILTKLAKVTAENAKLRAEVSSEDVEKYHPEFGAVWRQQEDKYEKLRTDFENLRNKCIKNEYEIEQCLGAVLGYPRYCDDEVNFPDASEADGVCVGEHTAITLAMEVANRIRQGALKCLDKRMGEVVNA